MQQSYLNKTFSSAFTQTDAIVTGYSSTAEGQLLIQQKFYTQFKADSSNSKLQNSSLPVGRTEFMLSESDFHSASQTLLLESRQEVCE